jgi:hypothetical protein
MRQFLLGLSISVAFILGCVTAQHVPGVAMPSASATTSAYTGQRWEYICETIGGSVRGATDVLNQFGAEGWELATPVDGVACFKRPL